MPATIKQEEYRFYMRSGSVVMNEFTKVHAAIEKWGWRRTAFLLALFLLVKQFVTFEQALILILLAALLEGARQELPSAREHPAVDNP